MFNPCLISLFIFIVVLVCSSHACVYSISIHQSMVFCRPCSCSMFSFSYRHNDLLLSLFLYESVCLYIILYLIQFSIYYYDAFLLLRHNFSSLTITNIIIISMSFKLGNKTKCLYWINSNNACLMR